MTTNQPKKKRTCGGAREGEGGEDILSLCVQHPLRKYADALARALINGGIVTFQGPMWVNLNWLTIRSLRAQQHAVAEARKQADYLEQKTLDVVSRWYSRFGTVFEFYDAVDAVPPTVLDRKAHRGCGGIRDYHFTAACVFNLLHAGGWNSTNCNRPCASNGNVTSAPTNCEGCTLQYAGRLVDITTLRNEARSSLLLGGEAIPTKFKLIKPMTASDSERESARARARVRKRGR